MLSCIGRRKLPNDLWRNHSDHVSYYHYNCKYSTIWQSLVKFNIHYIVQCEWQNHSLSRVVRIGLIVLWSDHIWCIVQSYIVSMNQHSMNEPILWSFVLANFGWSFICNCSNIQCKAWIAIQLNMCEINNLSIAYLLYLLTNRLINVCIALLFHHNGNRSIQLETRIFCRFI